MLSQYYRNFKASKNNTES